MHSVSGSRFDHWDDDRFGSSMYGATYRNFVNGDSKGSEDIPKNSTLPKNWSLSSLLSQNPCGSAAPVDELVVQLGSNHGPNENPVPFIQKILSQAYTNGVKEVKFILPPRGRDNPNKFLEFNKSAIAYLSGKKGVSCFNSTTEAELNPDDFWDKEHFWKKDSETVWLEKVKKWTYPDNPRSKDQADPVLVHSSNFQRGPSE